MRVFSGQSRGHPPHPPTHNSEPRQNIEMFLDSLYILPVSQALYFVKRSQELFYTTMTNQNFIEMISADYTNTAAGVWDEM